jgi:hypothetical protein
MRRFSWLRTETGGARPAPRSRPRLEALEDRCVPSVFPITSTLDDVNKPGTLRYAVANAGDGDIIRFSPALQGTPIVLTQGELLLTHNVTIQSQKDVRQTISGTLSSISSRVFEVASGASVTLSDVTIINGSSGFGGFGGGILVDPNATLALSDSTVSYNSGDYGGGIANSGTLTVANCNVSSNGASRNYGSGGGILNEYGGTLTVCDSTLSDNSAYIGGGIANYGGTATVSDCGVSGNFAGWIGGGIYNADGTLTLRVSNTLTGNSIQWNPVSAGPGIFDIGGAMNISGKTVSDGMFVAGTASIDGATVSGLYVGGDSYTPETLTNSTVTGGITNLGTLTVSGDTVSGGISNQGTLAVSGCSVSGGIFNAYYAILTVSGSTVAGGIVNFFGTATVASSIVSGGIDNQSGGALTVGGTIVDYILGPYNDSGNNTIG